ncbi:hypothetical protein K8Q93_03010 [Candidatus Parcubacteria bacterium]|nr:hypothetical protein [Candidatus Parcubacteria bacterium]
MFKKFKPTHKRILLNFSGWALIVFGGVGIFLPVLQGLLFLAIGFYLLSLHSPWFHAKLLSLRRRYPRFAGPLKRVDTWVRKQFGLEIETQSV